MNDENLIPYKPGQSGNPKGKPKGIVSLKSRLLKYLKYKIDAKNLSGLDEKLQAKDAVILSLIRRAIEGDVTAAKEIFDRIDGKTAQKMELAGKDGAPLPNPMVTINRVVMPAQSGTDNE